MISINKILFTAGALLCATSAWAVVQAKGTLGTRSASFPFAPSEKSMGLTEWRLAVASDPVWSLPEVRLGFTAAVQTLRDGLGSGLTEFSGTSFGPEILVRHKFGPVSPYGAVSYHLGRYEGKGTPTWGGNPVATRFFYNDEAITEQTKRFESQGTHLSAGVEYSFTPRFGAVAEVDLGYERMTTDTRVIEGITEVSGKHRGNVNSRGFAIGGSVAL